MFHLVSLSLQISLADLPGPCLGLCVGVACFWLVLFLVGFFLPGKFDFNLMLIPVVDRPCLALVRQCRKKNCTRFQAVFVSMSSAPSRRRRTEREHAMWRHVRPVSTDFAWLSPDLAHAFCSEALQLDPDRTYGDFRVAHLGMGERLDAALLI